MRVALYQGPGQGEPVRRLPEVAERAAAAGADLLVCPEMFATGYNIGERAGLLAEPAGGATTRRVGSIAAAAGVAVLYGYPERDGERVFNAAQLVDAGGRLVTGYRKTHLFGDIDRAMFRPGDEPVVQARLGGVTVGVLICYDVEFPELVRAHALAGTELLCVPTALMRPYEVVADTVVVSRAYENQIFLGYANRCDAEGELDYCGRSCLVGPDGDVLARAGGHEELLLADIDTARIAAARRDNTQLADRRPELYR